MSAGEVLDEMLQEGWPVFVVGNTVAEVVRELESEIADRAEALSPGSEFSSLPNRLTITAGSESAPATYRFEVNGFAVEEVEGPEVTPKAGEHAAGSVAGDADSFRFRGDLVDVAANGSATVRLNGEELVTDPLSTELDAEEAGQRPGNG